MPRSRERRRDVLHRLHRRLITVEQAERELDDLEADRSRVLREPMPEHDQPLRETGITPGDRDRTEPVRPPRDPHERNSR